MTPDEIADLLMVEAEALAQVYPDEDSMPAGSRLVAAARAVMRGGEIRAREACAAAKAALASERWRKEWGEVLPSEWARTVAAIAAPPKKQDDKPATGPKVMEWDEWEEYAMIPPRWLVNDLLEIGHVGMMVALPGVGKTVLGIELSRCVVMGDKFGKHQCVKGRVLYVCPDSPKSTMARLMGVPMPHRKAILTASEWPALPNGVEQLRQELKFRQDIGQPVSLVVLDTLDSMRASAGGAYSEQDDLFTDIMVRLRTLAEEKAIAIVILHHTSKTDKDGMPRGSSIIEAKLDWRGVVIQDDEDDRLLRLESGKLRDGIKGEVGRWVKQAFMAKNGRTYPCLSPPSEHEPQGPYLGQDGVRELMGWIIANGSPDDHLAVSASTGIPAADIPTMLRRLEEREFLTSKGRATKRAKDEHAEVMRARKSWATKPQDGEDLF